MAQQNAVALERITLAYTGNFKGFTRPCGCLAKQSGGLPRLGSVIEYLLDRASAEAPSVLPAGAVCEPPDGFDSKAPLVLVDCGNFSDANSRAPAVRARAHLAALAELGCKAAIIGGEELRLTMDATKVCFSEAPVPLTACNVEPLSDSLEVSTSVEIALGWFVVGVAVPTKDAPECEWARVGDAKAGVLRALQAMPTGSKVVVAGANIPPGLCGQISTLQTSGGKIVAVTGISPDGEGQSVPIIAPPARRAEHLQFVTIDIQAGSASEWDVLLDDTWPDDPEVLAAIKAGEEAQLQAIRIDPLGWKDINWGKKGGLSQAEVEKLEEGSASPPLDMQYVGADKCFDCHPDAAKAWESSRHRHSYAPLIDNGEAQTLDCLECHTTGLLRPGGYDPERSFDVLHDPLAAVGCESCHGPGAQHTNLAAGGKWQPSTANRGKYGIERGTLELCVACHDDYNSPKFDATSFWEKVKH